MSTPPKLVADIGATNTRFALYYPQSERLNHQRNLATKDFATIELAINTYLESVEENITEAAIAIANPVIDDYIQMTNHHWQFSIVALQQQLGLSRLNVINDLVAQALAIMTLKEDEYLLLSECCNDIRAPKVIIGPGTGLGVSALIPNGDNWQALATEGGHISFAPRNEQEINIWRYAQQQYGHHVSAERLLSGSGLVLIDSALAHLAGKPRQRTPQVITQCLANNDPTARATIDVFCTILANVAADLVLTLGARGGVYLCGGILPGIAHYMQGNHLFYDRFIAKGRFRQYLQTVPIYLVTAKETGLRGAAMSLKQTAFN